MSPRPQRGKPLMEALFGKSSSTPPPSREQRATAEVWRLTQENDHLRSRLSRYNDAVRSIVLRLKVLDIDKLREEMGEDGTIPMRMMLMELVNLQMAYDDKARPYGNTDSYTPSLTPSEPI